MAKQKYYVVWIGRKPGIYRSWDECRSHVEGFTGAKFMSFENEEKAKDALSKPYYHSVHAAHRKNPVKQAAGIAGKGPLPDSLSVDAAWNTVTKVMEYQGVHTASKKVYFRCGPYKDATNNVGEFLAIVHGLSFLAKNNSSIPVYSDSNTAICWLKKKKANTKLLPTPDNLNLRNLIARAEKWLHEHSYTNHVLKWNTELWGEIPADFGRK